MHHNLCVSMCQCFRQWFHKCFSIFPAFQQKSKTLKIDYEGRPIPTAANSWVCNKFRSNVSIIIQSYPPNYNEWKGSKRFKYLKPHQHCKSVNPFLSSSHLLYLTLPHLKDFLSYPHILYLPLIYLENTILLLSLIR